MDSKIIESAVREFRRRININFTEFLSKGDCTYSSNGATADFSHKEMLNTIKPIKALPPKYGIFESRFLTESVQIKFPKSKRKRIRMKLRKKIYKRNSQKRSIGRQG